MPSELDHSSQEPLYLQVIEDIRKDIASGLYRPGEKIPSEIELGDIYRVSRITVRNAVKVLEKEGLLIKRQGKGTFVTDEAEHKAPFENDDIVRSFTKTCENNGVVPGAHLVVCERVLLPTDKAGFFGGADNGAAVCVMRVRTADGMPLMVEDNLFDRSNTGSCWTRTSRAARSSRSSSGQRVWCRATARTACSAWSVRRPSLRSSSTWGRASRCSR